MKKTALASFLFSTLLTSSVAVKAAPLPSVNLNTISGLATSCTGLYYVKLMREKNNPRPITAGLAISQFIAAGCSFYNGISQTASSTKLKDRVSRWYPVIVSGSLASLLCYVLYNDNTVGQNFKYKRYLHIAVQLVACGCSTYNAWSAKSSAKEDQEKA